MKVNFIMLFITAFCSAIVGGEQHNKKDTVDVSMVIKHYKMFEKEMEIHADWPKEPFKSYPQTQMLKEKVDSIKEVTSIISDRPQAFENQDIVYKTIEHDGFLYSCNVTT